MKKLLLINSSLNFGSTGRICEEIGNLANSNGWITYMMHGARYVNSSSLISYQIGSPINERIHAIESLLFDRHGLGSRRTTKKAIEKIQEINPDLIHLHNIHGYYLNYLELFKFLNTSGIPIVWTIHDCWAFTGHCSHFSVSGCEKWKSYCHECSFSSSYPRSFVDRSYLNYKLKKEIFSSNRNLSLVTVSDWLKGIVEESFFKKNPIYRIYNGIDTNLFTIRDTKHLREKYNLKSKFVILGVASVWMPTKGLEDFLSLSKCLDDNFVIVLIGLNRNVIKKLPKNIIGIERTNSIAELSEFYSMADVFFNPSLQETMGLTTVEALSCGTPAIVYDVTACPEMVDDNTGFVVKARDISSVVEIIKKLSLNSEKLFCHDVCRERVLKYFRKEDRYCDYLKLYDKLLSTK